MKANVVRHVFWTVGLILFVLISFHPLMAEDKYPSRAMEIVCSFKPGGAADVSNRLIAKYLEKYLGTSISPLNKPGGGGVIGVTYVANGKPDGYIIGNFSDHMITAIILGNASYSLQNLRVVAQVSLVANTIAVRADAPWKAFQDFVDYAKKNPGMNFGHQGIGSSAHIRMENLNKIAGLNLIGVPFKGDGETVPALLGNHIPVAVVGCQAAKAQADAGNMRILFSFEPPEDIGLDPSIPFFADLYGKNTLDINIPIYLVVSSRVPEEKVRVLAEAAKKMTADPTFIEENKKLYFRTHYVEGEEVMQKLLPQKMERLVTLYKEVGMMK